MKNNFYLNFLIKNKDYIPLLSFKDWEINFEDSLKQITDLSFHGPQFYKSLAVFGNNLSLVLFHAGDKEASSGICKKMFSSFYERLKITQDTSLIPGLMQPWINLLRIQRILGNHQLVLRNVNSLKIFKKTSTNLEFEKGKELSKKFFNSSKEAKTVSNAIFIEILKSHLALNTKHPLMVSDDWINRSSWRKALVAEYEIIQMLKEKKFEDVAQKIIEYGNQIPLYKEYFIFRLCEILLEVEEYKEAIPLLLKIKNKLFHNSTDNFLDLGEFCQCLAKALYFSGSKENGVQLLKAQYEYFSQQQDEYGAIMALIELKKMGEKKITKNLQMKYSKTGYRFLRNKAAQEFKDIKKYKEKEYFKSITIRYCHLLSHLA